MKNLKYWLLATSILFIGVASWMMYDAYRPKVGPIGNGPDAPVLWTYFIFLILFGITLLGLAIYLFITDNKLKRDHKRGQTDPRYLITYSIFFGFMVVKSSITVVLSPDVFPRLISVITIIVLSAAIGAFVREVFHIKSLNIERKRER